MKVLFYGGCHAEVLCDIFNKYCTTDFTGALITNYRLIERGEAFPYESLPDYDAVLFSPILNKGDYNTAHLREACAARQLKTICYPWLQWNGYYPGLRKYAEQGWAYELLAERAKAFSDFEAYKAWVMQDPFTEAEILAMSEQSLLRLREVETSEGISLRLSDLVEAHATSQRLFLTPDHPTLFVYKRLARDIARQLGVALADEFYDSVRELHPDQFVPILPAVERALGLGFKARFAQFPALFKDKRYDFDEWLRTLYFAAPDRSVYVAGAPQAVRPRGAPPRHLDAGEMIILQSDAAGRLYLIDTEASAALEVEIDGEGEMFPLPVYG